MLQHLEAGAIDEDILARGLDDRRQLATQGVVIVLLELDPTSQVQLVDLQQAHIIGRQMHRDALSRRFLRGTQDDFFQHLDHGRRIERLGLIRCLAHALERLDMQEFQLTEKLAGGKRVERRAAQAFTQRLEQFGHHCQQAQAGVGFVVRLDAPDQLLQGQDVGLPLGGILAMLEAGQQQHLAPGVLHELHHGLRQDFAQHHLVQRPFNAMARQFGLGPALFGVANTLFKQFAAAALVTGEGQEIGQQLGENRRVIDEVVQQALHHLLDAQVQAVALMVVAIAPAHGRSRDFVKQSPGRMIATAEEALVLHRDLEHRDLQAADQGLEGVWQVVIVEDEFEHHRDQVDHVFIGAFDHPGLATAHADPGQQLFELATQIELVVNGRRRYVLLQMREQP
ncbi:hypothetical protein D3C76_832160 [compost metagenome]